MFIFVYCKEKAKENNLQTKVSLHHVCYKAWISDKIFTDSQNKQAQICAEGCEGGNP